jgi:hypothetical protein
VVPRKALEFLARVDKLGINPCVDVPHRVVRELQRASAKKTGPIPVRGRLNGTRFTTTVVRYAGDWRLYLNTAMRAEAATDVGDDVGIELEYDPTPRTVPMPPRFAAALAENPRARAAFDGLPPSHRKDILNYLNSLKTGESLDRNIKKAIAESLAGRSARRS